MGDYFGFDTWHTSIAMMTDDEVYDAITHNSRIQPQFDNVVYLRSRLNAGVQRIYPVSSLAALRSEVAGPSDCRFVLGDGIYYAVTDSSTADDNHFAIRSTAVPDLLWRHSSAYRLNTPGGFVVLSMDGKIPPQLLPGRTASWTTLVDMATAGKISDTLAPESVRELIRGSFTIQNLVAGEVCNFHSKPLMATNYSAYSGAAMALYCSNNDGANVLLETVTVPSGGSTPFPVFFHFNASRAVEANGTMKFSIYGAAAPDANLIVSSLSDSASLGTLTVVREVTQ